MKNPNMAFVVRRGGARDVSRVSDLLKVCWHATYDRMLGEHQSTRQGRHVYSKFSLGYFIVQSLVSRASTVLLATHDGMPIGLATAQPDGAEVILYGLYVHPDWQGKGIGSALLDAVIAGHPEAKAIRLEVLKDNAAAIAWYQAKGFESYGGTEHATGMADVPSLYMDKRLVAPTP